MVSNQHNSPTPRRTPSLRARIAATALVLSFGLGGAGIAAAQEATPAPSAQVICALPEATPSPSPVAGASPVAEGITAGPVVDDQQIIDELTQVVTACAPEGVSNLEVLTVYGFTDGRYGVDYQYLDGQQLVRMLDSYSIQSGTWTLENRMPLSPRSMQDTITASVKIGTAAGLELSPGQFPVQPAVNFHVNNQGGDAARFGLFSAPEGFDPTTLEGAGLDTMPEGFTELGASNVPAGTELDIIFEGLEPGSYAVVFFDAADMVTASGAVTIDPPIEVSIPDVTGGATATPAS